MTAPERQMTALGKISWSLRDGEHW